MNKGESSLREDLLKWEQRFWRGVSPKPILELTRLKDDFLRRYGHKELERLCDEVVRESAELQRLNDGYTLQPRKEIIHRNQKRRRHFIVKRFH